MVGEYLEHALQFERMRTRQAIRLSERRLLSRQQPIENWQRSGPNAWDCRPYLSHGNLAVTTKLAAGELVAHDRSGRDRSLTSKARDERVSGPAFCAAFLGAMQCALFGRADALHVIAAKKEHVRSVNRVGVRACVASFEVMPGDRRKNVDAP